MGTYRVFTPTKDGFNPDNCFLCGIALNKANLTQEHVFPQWLIDRFNLGNYKIAFPIGSREVGYRRITIPCCKTCNSEALAPLESRVRRNFVDVEDEKFDLTDEEMAIWSGKIYYGLILYQYYVALAENSTEEAQYCEQILRTGDMVVLHLLLQSLVKNIIFPSSFNFPTSVFHYLTQVHRELRRNFDFQTSSEHNCLILRLGHRGFLIAFDGGYLRQYPGYDFYKYQDRVLHPYQLSELAAHMMTLTSIKLRFRRYSKTIFDDKVVIEYYHEGYNNWYDTQHASEIFLDNFARLLRCDVSELLKGENKRISYLERNGKFNDIDINKPKK